MYLNKKLISEYSSIIKQNTKFFNIKSSSIKLNYQIIKPRTHFKKKLKPYQYYIKSNEREIEEVELPYTDERIIQTRDILLNLGLEEEKACQSIFQGFGWKTQKYWKKRKINEMPNPIEIKDKIEYFKSIGMTEDEIREIITKFPESLGCNLEGILKPNIEYLSKKYFLKGKARIKVILREPHIIGNIIDCNGDCQGQCSQCWAQF